MPALESGTHSGRLVKEAAVHAKEGRERMDLANLYDFFMGRSRIYTGFLPAFP